MQLKKKSPAHENLGSMEDITQISHVQGVSK